MWVHKTPEEIAAQQRKFRRAFGGPVLLAVVVFCAGVLKHQLFGQEAGLPPPPRVSSVKQVLVLAAISVPVMSVFFYLLQQMVGPPIFAKLNMGVGPRSVLICNSCYRMKNSDAEGTCACGGTFEDFDLWKWVDEPETQEGVDAGQHVGGDTPRGPGEIELEVVSWDARTAGRCAGTPRVRGLWHPAVLARRGQRTLTFEGTYDPPGTAWLGFVTAVVAVAIAVVVKAPPWVCGCITGCGIDAYLAVLLCRRRQITLRLENAGDVVVDEERRRIGFFLPFDHGPRWVVLEFKEAFVDASDAVRNVLGVKCRAGTIRGGNVWLVIFWLVVGFGIAFGYFRMKW